MSNKDYQAIKVYCGHCREIMTIDDDFLNSIKKGENERALYVKPCNCEKIQLTLDGKIDFSKNYKLKYFCNKCNKIVNRTFCKKIYNEFGRVSHEFVYCCEFCENPEWLTIR